MSQQPPPAGAPGQEPPAPAPPAPPALPAPPAPQPPTEGIDSLPEWAQKQLREARADAAKYRTRADGEAAAAKQAADDLKAKLAAALGITTSEAPDPEELARQAEAARTDARRSAVQLAALRAASGAGVDGDAMLDSVTVTRQLDDLDPAATDFTTRLTEIITAAKERYPSTRSPAAPGGRTSTPVTGSQAGTGQITSTQGMSPEEIAKAFAEGRFQSLLAGGAPR